MRISLLIKREDFFDILNKSLLKYLFELQEETRGTEKYVINKYLNFIVTPNNKSKHFKVLTNEYASTQVFWKKWLQKSYVYLAVNPMFRSFLSQKKVVLPSFFSNYLILGGNHRLRLFSNELKGSLVILKRGEREQYIVNDNLVREEHKLSYAPKILNKGKSWFIETVFYGIPLNRLKTLASIKRFRNKIYTTHFNELISSSLFEISLKEYKKAVLNNTEFVINQSKNKNIEVNSEQLIVDTLVRLFNIIILETPIKIAWSHGDFQEANMLIGQNEFRVIDWEAADKRFYLYDQFVLFGRVREGNSFKKAFEELHSNFQNLYSNEPFIKPLLLIEELRFSINEEFSKNFYVCGKKTVQLCLKIQSYLDEEKSNFN